MPTNVRELKRLESYVMQPVAEAGDVLLFTEALVHSTGSWQAKHERRTFLYKYSPGHTSYSQNYYSVNDYFNPTAQQRRILSPPSADERDLLA